MKIALLAPKHTGKTCYLTALYGELDSLTKLSSDTMPFTFTFNEIEHVKTLDSNYDLLIDGEVPKPTDLIEEFPLSIKSKNDNICSTIELIDFPGETLNSSGHSEDVEKVKSLLVNYDAFIILIDGEHASKTGRVFERKTGISKINEILYEVVKRKKETKYTLNGIPFVFTISKFDMIQDNPESIARAYSNIKESFPNFFSSNSENISIITQVSLGKNIDGKEEDKDKGEYNPENILLPFMLSVGIGTLSGSRYGYEVKNFYEKELEKNRTKYEQEEQYFKSADSVYTRRKNLNIFERIGDFASSGGKFESELQETKVTYEKDRDKASDTLNATKYNLQNQIKEINDFREIGSKILNSIDKKVFMEESCEAFIYKNSKKHTLRNNIGSEMEDIFIMLKD